jgi:plastocyanin
VKRIYLLLVSFALISVTSAASLAVETITVKMKSLSYDPKQIEAQVGDTVVWTNNAFSKHTATSDDDGQTFDTGEIKPDETSKPIKLEKQGEIKYHCKIHGKSMSGTIVVKPTATN